MSWQASTIGEVLAVIKNGVNCTQNKEAIGNKITRIETISNQEINFERVGYSALSEYDKEKSKLVEGDILFSHINSPIHVGKTGIYSGGEDLYHGINLLLLRTKPEVNPYFFDYFLKNLFYSGYWKRTCKQAINQASVNQKDISSVSFSYPDLSTQKEIVSKLDDIFARTDDAIQCTSKNFENVKSVFEAYLDNIFLKNTNNWTTHTIPEVSVIKPPKSEIRGLPEDTLVSFMPMEALGINRKYAVPNQERLISDVSGSYTYFKEGDVLLAKITPCFENGKLGIAKKLTSQVGFGSSEYLVFRPTDSVINEWLYYFFCRESFRKEGANNMSGAVGHKRVKKEFIENVKLPIPSIDIQHRIIKTLEYLHNASQSLLEIYEKKIRLCDALKKSALNQEFNTMLAKA